MPRLFWKYEKLSEECNWESHSADYGVLGFFISKKVTDKNWEVSILSENDVFRYRRRFLSVPEAKKACEKFLSVIEESGFYIVSEK